MKKQNGITLISLIITIIIMLILAGVSLSMVMGDGSMLDQANAAADKTAAADISEYVELAVGSNKISKYSKLGVKTRQAAVDELYDQGRITSEQKADIEDDWKIEIISGQEIDFTRLPESDSTSVTYTVKFYNAAGTSLIYTETVNNLGKSNYTTVPTISGYTFQYWATVANGTTKADLDYITSDMNVYAYFIANPVCFIAGTPVLTVDGLVNIEDIQVGMKVYSRNIETNETEIKEVKNTFINYVDKDITKVTVKGEVIESTSKHEYYTVNRGWVDAKDLVVGDLLLTSEDDKVVVENVETVEGTENTVYNFEVEGNHNYFVGNESVLVHNASSANSPVGDSSSYVDSTMPPEDEGC